VKGIRIRAALALLAVPVAMLAADGPVQFVDVTAAAKIAFKHTSGAFGKKYLPETMGSGVAFLDYDADGWPDLFFVNSKPWPGRPGGPTRCALYRNGRDGTFGDVTRAAGLGVELYGLGAAAADYDNDGWQDLYVTALGGNRLFRNRGDGRFEDVTAKAGVQGGGFGTSAMFFDFDKDGRLDLFVANYVSWSIEKDLFCTLDGRTKSYCTPESYKGESVLLLRNRGDGTFEDVTRRAGLFDPTSKALGVALIDFDGDAWPDLLVANDTQPNKLYRNRGDGRFEDLGVPAGIAFGETGVARAGMGVDAADYADSGRAGIVIGNFSNEMLGLYHNEGNGLFVDEAPSSTVGRASLLTLAFAAFFFDYDLDGRLDVFAANGHVADDIASVQPKVTYAQPPHLFRNLGGRRFEEAGPSLGPAFARPRVARGAAYADYDNDGDLDLAVNVNNGPAVLLRNEGGNRNGFVRVRTRGTRSNRDGIGAKVILQLSGGARPWRLVHSGSSYCSQSELPLTFGLGGAAQAEAVEVVWPSGQVDRTGPVKAGQAIVVEEGKGIVSSQGLPAKGQALDGAAVSSVQSPPVRHVRGSSRGDSRLRLTSPQVDGGNGLDGSVGRDESLRCFALVDPLGIADRQRPGAVVRGLQGELSLGIGSRLHVQLGELGDDAQAP
jgi:hypothetical protein